VNRIDGRRLLDALAGSAADAQEPESILKFKTILNADVTLTGVMRMTGDKAELLLSLHDVSTAKQLIQLQYREKFDASFNSMFPAATDSSGRIFYFSIMDGVVSPQCRHCPQPEFTDQARATNVSGTVVLSVLVAADGTPHQIRLVKSVEPGLDQASANIMRTWLFEPARDSAGNPVPVRVGVEVGFHRY
jgi:TonB family protein